MCEGTEGRTWQRWQNARCGRYAFVEYQPGAESRTNKTATIVRQGAKIRPRIKGRVRKRPTGRCSPGTHPRLTPARETRVPKAAWWWASRKVSSGQGLHLSCRQETSTSPKVGNAGTRGKFQGSLSFASSFQGTCYLFFLWPKPKHHFDPTSTDSAWQRQFRLL
jgi:hypothetical protein